MGSIGQFLGHLAPDSGIPGDLQADLRTIVSRQQLALMGGDQCLHRPHVGIVTTDERGSLLALDSGCLWGGHLTAVRLEDRRIFQVDCSPAEVQPLKR